MGGSSWWVRTSPSATTQMILSTDVGPSWDLLADLQLLLQYHFMQNALIVARPLAALGGADEELGVFAGAGLPPPTRSRVVVRAQRGDTSAPRLRGCGA